ncbi:hypothetical protein, partial [Anaerorhabdus sp.]
IRIVDLYYVECMCINKNNIISHLKSLKEDAGHIEHIQSEGPSGKGTIDSYNKVINERKKDIDRIAKKF